MSGEEALFEKTEQILLGLLGAAANLKLSLSNNEEDYHIGYVTKKITECGVNMEKLSDIQMQLTKISLEITKSAQKSRYLLKKEIDVITAGAQYTEIPSASRAHWIRTKTEAREKEVESLNYLTRVVGEVKEAVSERLQTMKRLDSDVRLHQKLLENGAAPSNATSRTSFVGASSKDLDI